MANGSPIAPALLRHIDEFIDEETLSTALDQEFDRDSRLIVFCRELFGQLFANVVGEAITGFGPTNAERASVLRRKNRSNWPPPLRRLVGHFLHYCKLHSDLLGEGYSGGSEARSEFYFEFLPSLLRDLEIWGRDAGGRELLKAIAGGRERYDRYLAGWEPDWEVSDA
jgi:hypothetical protein